MDIPRVHHMCIHHRQPPTSLSLSSSRIVPLRVANEGFSRPVIWDWESSIVLGSSVYCLSLEDLVFSHPCFATCL